MSWEFCKVFLKISLSFFQWNHFENRLKFGKVIAKILQHLFFSDTVHIRMILKKNFTEMIADNNFYFYFFIFFVYII